MLLCSAGTTCSCWLLTLPCRGSLRSAVFIARTIVCSELSNKNKLNKDTGERYHHRPRGCSNPSCVYEHKTGGVQLRLLGHTARKLSKIRLWVIAGSAAS